ncbi:hypothetical protein KC343_g15253 [Hortaea werneckii]|nr:hypothetical protein KC352_g19477 [Hortaea werneckii]KAI7555668.1 hypothetical protein KC317_g12790 [Hortaea werneckii]KAI7601447.1 hypothetical protein KC343_g15253 [Hortaea werneckii]KAI7608235.1 hypothetical protein KC346_g9694 [Hortaea werneckii]KAI7659554.1 hypothetical protein KC319_g8927 [Hortaea werneckii]
MSAVAKVFKIIELLEAILLELPMKDLLRTQQVRKHWKQVIVGSNAIQKALFMRPGGAAEAAVDSFRYRCPKADVTMGEIAINPCFFDNDGIKKDYMGFTCFLPRRAIDSRDFPRNFALMSITQSPIKLRMFIRFERGEGTPIRRTGVRGKAQKTHTGHTISEMLTQIRSSPRGSAQKSADNDTKYAGSAIELTGVWFCFHCPK